MPPHIAVSPNRNSLTCEYNLVNLVNFGEDQLSPCSFYAEANAYNENRGDAN